MQEHLKGSSSALGIREELITLTFGGKRKKEVALALAKSSIESKFLAPVLKVVEAHVGGEIDVARVLVEVVTG